MQKCSKYSKKPILLIKSNNKYILDNYNFEKRNFQIINSNILEVQELEIEKIEGSFTIIITSINAIFALKELKIPKNNKIFTVGEVSANILQNLGYHNIIYGHNSAKSLLDKIIQENLIEKTENILYLSGEKVTINIAKKLEYLGYKSYRKIIYKINSKNLLDKIILDLKNNDINDIAFFSKNGVDIFYDLCQKNNIDLSNKIIHCFSQNIVNYFNIILQNDDISCKPRTLIFSEV